MSLHVGSLSMTKASSQLIEECNCTVDKFPSFIMSLKQWDQIATWDVRTLHKILTFTVNGTAYWLLSDYHSISAPVIKTAHINWADSCAIQNSWASIILSNSLEGNLCRNLFNQARICPVMKTSPNCLNGWWKSPLLLPLQYPCKYSKTFKIWIHLLSICLQMKCIWPCFSLMAKSDWSYFVTYPLDKLQKFSATLNFMILFLNLKDGMTNAKDQQFLKCWVLRLNQTFLTSMLLAHWFKCWRILFSCSTNTTHGLIDLVCNISCSFSWTCF